jgi:hypothetical protein
MLFLSAVGAIIFFAAGMFFHDYQISRPLEITFLALAAAFFLLFEYFLHQK